MSELRFKPLRDGVTVPSRANADDAGFDLHAAPIEGSVTIAPRGTAIVGTGVALALPAGTVGLVCPRSGLAAKRGLTVLNAPGIIDAGYRGELGVILHNTTDEARTILDGDRIAQLVVTTYLAPHVRVLDDGEDLDDTDRGAGGFGSTGA